MVTGWDALVLLVVAVGTERTLAGCSAAASPRAASTILVPPARLLPHPGLGGVVLVALLLIVVAVT